METEWLEFGHKFADRCGHGENSEDLNERCPVFLQWLDCVHQLQRQFPCSFEFNEAFLVCSRVWAGWKSALSGLWHGKTYHSCLLSFFICQHTSPFMRVSMQVKLVQHTYSCLFGTFLCNSGKERVDRHIQERTCSVWSLLRPANRSLRNMLYSSHSETVCFFKFIYAC